MLDWSGHTCLLQGGVDYAFRHLGFWFNTDPNELISHDPFKSLLAAQRVGNIKPKGPVYISHNRWDPLIPYQAARQTAEDWCNMGADVEFWTNEQPALFNKTDINNLLQPYVDGERSMAWVADRFNGLPQHRTVVSSRSSVGPAAPEQSGEPDAGGPMSRRCNSAVSKWI